MHDLRIALIQTNQFWEDKKANFHHLETVHFPKIKPGECDLILLPEMFNTGFSMNTITLAEEMTGESIQWLQRWAEYFDCQVSASLMIRDQNRFYNRFIIVSKHGVEAHYDKRHLFRRANENQFYTAGEERVLHTLKGWKILLQVCYDLRFPVFSRNRTVNGEKEYDAVIYIANWPQKRRHIWLVLLQARAIENQAYCVGLNRVGEDGNGISYSGDSAVVDPWGTVEYQATGKAEEVKILTLSRQKLEEIAVSFPAFKDADSI